MNQNFPNGAQNTGPEWAPKQFCEYTPTCTINVQGDENKTEKEGSAVNTVLTGITGGDAFVQCHVHFCFIDLACSWRRLYSKEKLTQVNHRDWKLVWTAHGMLLLLLVSIQI